MKRDRRTVDTRHKEMLSLIHQREEITVEELSQIFGISTMTVRRDLQSLEKAGKVSRFHGGVTADPRHASSYEKGKINLYRSLIAYYAASLVGEGERILINGSDTALSIVNHLGGRHVLVFTNNSHITGRKYSSSLEIQLSGGLLKSSDHILTGDLAMRNLMDLYADKAFLGCTGISPNGEILCGIPSELAINETMIEHSDSYYILADHTKIGKTSAYASFHLEKKGCVITDECAPQEVINHLRAVGMQVIQIRKDDYPDIVKHEFDHVY